MQFVKEERIDGAVYSVYLKKVRYHTSADELENVDSVTVAASHAFSSSKFYVHDVGISTEVVSLFNRISTTTVDCK